MIPVLAWTGLSPCHIVCQYTDMCVSTLLHIGCVKNLKKTETKKLLPITGFVPLDVLGIHLIYTSVIKGARRLTNIKIIKENREKDKH